MTTYRAPIREIGLIGVGAFALYLLLAVVSHSPSDPSYTFSGESGEVRNWVGASGAYVADLFLFVFGWVAYMMPLAVLAVGVRVVVGSGNRSPWFTATLRSVGWIVVTLCACVLVQAHVPSEGFAMPAGSGGALGEWLAQYGLPAFGFVGLTLLGVAGILTGAQTALGFSWLDVAEWLGARMHHAFMSLVAFAARRAESVGKRRAARKAARSAVRKREQTREKDRSRRQKRRPPNIEPPAAKAVEPEQAGLFDAAGVGPVPDMALLDDKSADDSGGFSEESLKAMSRQLELKLAEFGVEAEVTSVLPGPVVTRFEMQPAPGVRAQKITALARDLARSLAVISVRVVEVIPGKSVIGIEIPNENREMVRLKEIFATSEYEKSKSPLTLALGKDVAGAPVVTDVSRMPHLLIAGTTGSGKSVGVNAMLISILYKASPDDVRLILVDPKMLELAVYEGIPHLLAPVVTDMSQAGHALNWCVAEMERRYRLMAALGVRNLAGFNRKVRDGQRTGRPLVDPLAEEDGLEQASELIALPFIVVVIDEFADMMMVARKQVEQLIARIAQKARAAGIHLVLATQRPSVDVITGLIKANIPARISFQVSSRADSGTILDQGGAEQLLGHGDMLFLPPGTSVPNRVHGAFVSDEEVHRVVRDWKQRGEPNYDHDILRGGAEGAFVDMPSGSGDAERDDPLYDEAVAFVIETRRPSISAVQRKLRIGYNRAARLIEAMEQAGVVTPMNGNGSRDVLVGGD